MADNMAPPDQGAKREQHDFHNEATQQGPQAASQQPLRPAMVMGLKSDAAGRKDSDSMSTKSGASKGASVCSRRVYLARRAASTRRGNSLCSIPCNHAYDVS